MDLAVWGFLCNHHRAALGEGGRAGPKEVGWCESKHRRQRKREGGVGAVWRKGEISDRREEQLSFPALGRDCTLVLYGSHRCL